MRGHHWLWNGIAMLNHSHVIGQSMETLRYKCRTPRIIISFMLTPRVSSFERAYSYSPSSRHDITIRNQHTPRSTVASFAYVQLSKAAVTIFFFPWFIRKYVHGGSRRRRQQYEDNAVWILRHYFNHCAAWAHTLQQRKDAPYKREKTPFS